MIVWMRLTFSIPVALMCPFITWFYLSSVQTDRIYLLQNIATKKERNCDFEDLTLLQLKCCI